MKRYVVEFHTTGLVWNDHVGICHRVADHRTHSLQGISVSEYKLSRSQPVTGPSPPPPPPPPPPGGPAPSPPAVSTSGVAAVFADLNRGADVTKGLRKVDKSEMTHKNPALRAGSVVPASSGTGEIFQTIFVKFPNDMCSFQETCETHKTSGFNG